MGTRNLVCVYYKGKFVVDQYEQFDGYPSRQGIVIYRFLITPGNVARLKAGLEHVKLLKTDADLAPYNELLAQDKLPACLHRNAGGKILELVANATAAKPVSIQLKLEFAHNHMFCEWIYVVNLDTEKLEVYTGVRDGSTEEAQARFAEVGGSILAHAKTYGFDDLPKKSEIEFVKELDPEDDLETGQDKEQRMVEGCAVI